MKSKVVVLMGGTSSEREISLKSGHAVLQALLAAGVDAVALDLQANWVEQLIQKPMDVAFVALHGALGEDGCVQGLLEIMGVPYTGSGVLASALCMHKKTCKSVLSQAGLAIAEDIVMGRDGPELYPAVLKPACEGSSVGLHMLQNQHDWQGVQPLENILWMAEKPLQGVEVAVSVLHGQALPVVEIAPNSGVYDFVSKYTSGATNYYCPARLKQRQLDACAELARHAVAACYCRGAPRVDMIVLEKKGPVILEINTVPGMTSTSLLPKSAAQLGLSFEDLCLNLLEHASLDKETH
ncbi:MAG: D-alanine--D-alanine ligase [Mariprofundaceae bacterium]|nr:D-alanine--D-alanine ligase [Mariprofundaceae bacterium]